MYFLSGTGNQQITRRFSLGMAVILSLPWLILVSIFLLPKCDSFRTKEGGREQCWQLADPGALAVDLHRLNFNCISNLKLGKNLDVISGFVSP